jgi:beta-glucosidase
LPVRSTGLALTFPSANLVLPSLDFELETEDGKRGWTGTWFAHESDDSDKPLSESFGPPLHVDETRMFFSYEVANKGITRRWSMRVEGKLKPRDKDCEFEFGLTVSGRAKVHERRL